MIQPFCLKPYSYLSNSSKVSIAIKTHIAFYVISTMAELTREAGQKLLLRQVSELIGCYECCLPEHFALSCCEQSQVWGSHYLKQTLAFGSTFSSQNETKPETELTFDIQNSSLRKTKSKQRKETPLLKLVGIKCL